MTVRLEPVSFNLALQFWRTMLTIRAFEERVVREFRTGDIPGFVHTYIGQESVAVGICANLTEADYITSTHRGHGHAVAKGCDLKTIMAEIYGRETGLCKGRGGSMHVADFDRGMAGANAIVGGGIAFATGAGLSAQVRGSDQVTVAFFGDGAANQGVLHESLNLAAIWKLPVVYVCENNGFAESTPASYSTSIEDVAERAAGYGIPGVVVDSRNVLDVYDVGRKAVSRARGGQGPTFIEAKTYRIRGHYEGDPDLYRDDEDRRRTQSNDPIPLLRESLLESGATTPSELESIQREILEEVDEAVAFAQASPWPDPAELERYVYAEDS